MNWYGVKDGDGVARWLMSRHYSHRNYTDGRKPKLFVGPGEKMVLLTNDGQAVFVWRKFIDDAQPHQDGVNCAAFRNEGAVLSSDLIREACDIAWQRWPGERLYTYVNAAKIRSTNPGYCFKAAGWTQPAYKTTKTGLIVLEIYP